ncbi:MAG TPA: hypothetical protein VF503_10540 [Sphingobium sp.]|uniref:beta strand repeat-containing protein n=1 Tax=Sphingobium sp. TaxID=1912891 RepID=UPI002ED53073
MMKTRKLSPWLVRTSVLAIGVSIIAFSVSSPVSSQSFNASGHSVAAGDIYSVSSGSGTTNVVLNSASTQAVIDWTPDNGGSGTITFQNAGTTASFSRLGGGDFAVLNRIVPSDTNRAIRLDGNIRGWLDSANTVTGGTVFFYSPGGIIIGSTARIDVGALGLTTISPQITSNGFITINGNSQTVTYDSSLDSSLNPSGKAITIESGARINALMDSGSYVSLFAPTITQNGIIDVNGSTAIVAAEAGTLTWNDNGLFNVQVTTGTTGDASGVAINHGGATGGTVNGTGATNFHRVYMVSVPKNSAITTLVSAGSTLGFTIAGGATPTSNGVVLTAGYNIDSSEAPIAAGGTGAANIQVTNSDVRSFLTVAASGNATVQAQAGGLMNLGAGVDISGGVSANMIASGANSRITSGGDVTLGAIVRASGNPTTIAGGTTLLRSENGASIDITGGAVLNSSAYGAQASTGGTSTVDVTNGSTLTLTSGLLLRADGYGTNTGPYGDGIGGTIQLFVNGSGSRLSAGGLLELSANGYGAVSSDAPGLVAGGSGTGGTAQIQVGSTTGLASLVALGLVTVHADGTGAFTAGTAPGSFTGGAGNGGTASLGVAGPGSVLDMRGGPVSVSANGFGGSGNGSGNGGAAMGGTASITGNGGNLLLVNPSISANATGGGLGSGSGTGGNATGGSATFSMDGGGQADITTVSGTALQMTADARGGVIYFGASGGNAISGAVGLQSLNGSTITVHGQTSLSATAFGGMGGGSADGRRDLATQAPSIRVLAEGGSIKFTDLLTATADGKGGDAFSSGNGGRPGAAAYAGSISIVSNTVASGSSLIDAQAMRLSAVGTGGRAATVGTGSSGFAGGIGNGGQIVLTGQGGNGLLQATDVNAMATGLGGLGSDADVTGGPGGQAFGGSIIIGTTEGLASSATSGGAAFGNLMLDASAVGGNGGLGFYGGGATGAGGAASGGRIHIGAAGSTVTAGGVTLNAGAQGGNAGSSPNYTLTLGSGGDATVGQMEIIVSGRSGSAQTGMLQATQISGLSSAIAGVGSVAGGRYFSAGPVFSITNGGATLGGVNLIVDALAASSTLATPAARLVLDNAAVVISDGFVMRTPGNLSVYANRASLGAASLNLTAGDFVVDALGSSPDTPGTLSANAIAINSGNNILLSASLNSQSLLNLNALGQVFVFDLTSTNDIGVGAGGAVTLRNLSAGGLIGINTPSTLSIGTARAARNIQLDAAGSISTGGMDAGDSVIVRSSGGIVVNGAVTAGINPIAPSGAHYDIGIYAAGPLRTGDLRAAGRVGLVSGQGTIDAGAIGSTSDVLLLSSGNVSVSSIASTGDASRYVYIGNSSILSGVPSETFDPSPIFATAPVALNGTITATGGISGGTILFANTGSFSSGDIRAGGDLTGRSGTMTDGGITTGGNVSLSSIGSVTANSINAGGAISLSGTDIIVTGDVTGSQLGFTGTGSITLGGTTAADTLRAVTSGNINIASANVASLIDLRSDTGLLSITGTINAPSITFSSNDIAIGSGARIDAGNTGLIRMLSTNPQGMRIGDGTTGTGYLLDKAEFATLHSGSVVIAGVDGTSTVDMTIGDLNITGPLAGSTIDDPSGSVTFFTGDFGRQAASGTIRVTGSLRASGFLATNGIRFSANLFEIDAQTGLIEILGQGSSLGGTLFFDAQRIHVAQQSILNRLAQNPLYAGRAVDLNTPLSTARPDGVVRVGTINLGAANAVLVQNTGTGRLPAGFLTSGGTFLDRQMALSPGSVDLIINGQLQESGGLLAGSAVLNFLIDDTNRAYFTPGSSINGCPVAGGSCFVANDVEIPAQILQSDNLLVTQIPPGFNQPGQPQSDNPDETAEEQRERELAEKEARSLPIPPPTSLINTQPLNPTTDLDEPISGSGNPSLIGGGTTGMAIGKGKQ